MTMRRARIRTTHATPAVASVVADALTPDNTASMTTRVEAATVTTGINRDTTGGLQSTVDDYVVNLGVAEGVLDAVDTAADAGDDATDTADADEDSDIAPTEDSTAAEPTTDNTTQS